MICLVLPLVSLNLWACMRLNYISVAYLATPAVEIPPTKLPRPNAGNSDLASEPSPSLLHIAHPYALASLQALLQHVRRLRMQVATSTASTEGAKIAQDVLVDVIACSGVDLDKFDGLLSEIGTEVKKLDCKFTSSLYRASIANACPRYQRSKCSDPSPRAGSFQNSTEVSLRSCTRSQAHRRSTRHVYS